MGFSLLSGAEILYYFTMRAFFTIVREKGIIRNIIVQERSTFQPEYVLGQTPYLSMTLPGYRLNEFIKQMDFEKTRSSRQVRI